MNDLISRQAAIDALDGEIEITGRTNAEAVMGYVRLVRDRLERLPSAQPMEVQEAYYRGKIDGIKECTARLKNVTKEFDDGRSEG